MSKELVISAGPHETRVAIVEDGQLCEIYIEREKEFALVGSLYKGRVTRVLPGMQSAFVDIGLDSDAFLYVSDFLENLEDYDHVAPVVKAPMQPHAPAPRGAEASGSSHRQAPAHESASADDSNVESMAASGEQPHATEHPDAAPAENVPAAFEGGETVPSEADDPSQPAQAQPPHSPQQTHQPHEQRPNRGQGGGFGDRDRRGRRWGRRGRGGRQGRELPSSKYASPRAPDTRGREHESYEPPANYQPIILPGESLAKYKERAPAAPSAPDEAQAPAKSPNVESAGPARVANSETGGSLPSSLYATPLTEAQAPSAAKPPADAASRDAEFTYAQPFAPDSPAIREQPEDKPRAMEPPNLSAGNANVSEEIEYAAETGAPLSDEEMSSLAEQLVDVKHEEAQSGMEEAAEAAIVPFVEDAELEELEDALNEDEAEEEAEERAEEEENENDLLAEELHEQAMADSAAEAAEGAEQSGEHAAESAEDRATAQSSGASESQPVNARVSQPPRARFQRPMRRGGRPRRRGGPGHEQRRSFPQQRRPQLISEVLKAGQEIIVQIAKEPLGKKGARITSHVALPGRFLVYMPTVDHIGVSHRIGSVEDRSRLRRVVTEAKGTFPGGFIVRTAAASATDDEIRADAEFLGRTWDSIRNSAEPRHAPALLHRDLNLVERILRDYLSDDYAAIWIDSEEEYGKVLEFVGRFQPRLINRVKLYTKESPIFEEFGIQQELDKALRPKVWLKSGGYIVINHTEALVAIDVNTGKFVGRGSTRLEDTIVRTNLEAVNEIVRQIRLRDLGGIIVVDFIDMEERRNREKVLSALEQSLHQDRAPSKALAFNEFGLVCITRKRTKQALERVLCQPCPYCTGSGMVKSIPTICYEIQGEARKMAAELDARSVTLRVNPEIAKALKTRESLLVDELEQTTRKSVIIQSDPTLHWEQYDIY